MFNNPSRGIQIGPPSICRKRIQADSNETSVALQVSRVMNLTTCEKMALGQVRSTYYDVIAISMYSIFLNNADKPREEVYQNSTHHSRALETKNMHALIHFAVRSMPWSPKVTVLKMFAYNFWTKQDTSTCLRFGVMVRILTEGFEWYTMWPLNVIIWPWPGSRASRISFEPFSVDQQIHVFCFVLGVMVPEI